MEVYEAIRTILAVRQYQETPIPDDAVRRIVEAGRLTSSASNKQPWHFIVVRERETLRRLGESARSGAVHGPGAVGHRRGGRADLVRYLRRQSGDPLDDADRLGGRDRLELGRVRRPPGPGQRNCSRSPTNWMCWRSCPSATRPPRSGAARRTARRWARSRAASASGSRSRSPKAPSSRYSPGGGSRGPSCPLPQTGMSSTNFSSTSGIAARQRHHCGVWCWCAARPSFVRARSGGLRIVTRFYAARRR